MALKEAVKEYIYLINLLKGLDIKNSKLYYLFTDNQPAIDLAKNLKHHAKSKHIDIQYHYIREKVLEGLINLNYTTSEEQLADILTKSLNLNTFNTILQYLGLKNI